jgi:hypothetical protein
MSCRRKPVVSVLAVAALAALSLGATAQFEAPAHHQAAHRAALVTHVAPAQLDAMRFMTATRLGAVRAEEAREERAEARAEAWRQHEAVLLAARHRALAVQAARAHVAATTAVRVRAVAPAVSQAVYSYSGLEALWLAAGGNPAYEATAACIATHESGGRANAISATADYGVFQEHMDPAALNPQVSAVTAVRMSSDGRDWSAWTTSGYC